MISTIILGSRMHVVGPKLFFQILRLRKTKILTGKNQKLSLNIFLGI